ncbi:MAG: hypothetical protein ABUL58_07855 [Steroidobacter sp.]
MIDILEKAITANNGDAVQTAIFQLGKACRSDGMVSDEVALDILSVLRRQELWQSHLSGHILNFFEFESSRLSDHVKHQCRTFLSELGTQFTDVHSMQVVTELIHGPYLKPKESKVLRRKPRWQT